MYNAKRIDYLIEKARDVILRDFRYVSYIEIKFIPWSLSKSNALGRDGLPSEAFMYVPDSLVVLLNLRAKTRIV